ncbi:hypothetical protein FACUT_12862 [Fusarium acutatum]|uniref:RING-type domain-containing protein n=1 Tax=Fusarium acutatum TaxID=78861 RepID=A0A8H4JAG4_9HYPO|nr:hypothetical protein FACUT_12862 [Fusarium acutatum]
MRTKDQARKQAFVRPRTHTSISSPTNWTTTSANTFFDSSFYHTTKMPITETYFPALLQACDDDPRDPLDIQLTCGICHEQMSFKDEADPHLPPSEKGSLIHMDDEKLVNQEPLPIDLEVPIKMIEGSLLKAHGIAVPDGDSTVFKYEIRLYEPRRRGRDFLVWERRHIEKMEQEMRDHWIGSRKPMALDLAFDLRDLWPDENVRRKMDERVERGKRNMMEYIDNREDEEVDDEDEEPDVKELLPPIHQPPAKLQLTNRLLTNSDEGLKISTTKDLITAAYYTELAKIINNDPTAIERLEIECGMCQDKMSNPEDKTCSAIIFPCGHMFCPSCVKDYRTHMLRVTVEKREEKEIRAEFDKREVVKQLPISSELLEFFRIAGDSLDKAWNGPRAPGDGFPPFNYDLALCKRYLRTMRAGRIEEKRWILSCGWCAKFPKVTDLNRFILVVRLEPDEKIQGRQDSPDGQDNENPRLYALAAIPVVGGMLASGYEFGAFLARHSCQGSEDEQQRIVE